MKKPLISLTPEQKEEIKNQLRTYLEDEHDLELGNLAADIFTDFLAERIGKHYYNVGVLDTIAATKERVEDLVLLLKE